MAACQGSDGRPLDGVLGFAPYGGRIYGREDWLKITMISLACWRNTAECSARSRWSNCLSVALNYSLFGRYGKLFR